jgi:hypothetical protein
MPFTKPPGSQKVRYRVEEKFLFCIPHNVVLRVDPTPQAVKAIRGDRERSR